MMKELLWWAYFLIFCSWVFWLTFHCLILPVSSTIAGLAMFTCILLSIDALGDK